MRTQNLHPRDLGMDFRFCLVFPRESLSIPVMRKVLGDTLGRLGVDEESISDLLLAATEACTNVLQHAGPGWRYEVVVKVGRRRCVLQVLDNGRGFYPARLAVRRSHLRRPPVRPAPLPVSLLRRRPRNPDLAQLPETGRGLAIMRACVDDVSLRSGPGKGTVVQMRKRIEWRDDAPLVNMSGSALRDAG